MIIKVVEIDLKGTLVLSQLNVTVGADDGLDNFRAVIEKLDKNPNLGQ